MAKLAPGVKLLRSLTRAAKLHQKRTVKLLAAVTPKPAKLPKPPKPPGKPAPRPAAAPLPGKWLVAQHALPATPGSYMPYWLYVPSQMPETVAQNGWPLVIMLHGCQQSATEFAEGTRMNRLAEDKGYAVLYPQQPTSAQPQRCWRWYDRATQQGGGETAALVQLIDNVCRQHPIDRRRMYACGLSAGAGMAAVLALNHPELIAAVGLHSGPVFGAGQGPLGALQVMRHGTPMQADAAIAGLLERRARQAFPAVAAPMPPMPAILIQGANDRVVNPLNQQLLAHQWLQLNGLPAGPASRVAVKAAARRGGRNAYEIHDYLVARKLVLRVARIAGLGHAWSGGDPALKFNAGAGPDASRMVLDFFGRHRRQAGAGR